MKKRIIILFALCFLFPILSFAKTPLVLQTDFGLKDGAVSTMKGVALTVDPTLGVYDVTHEIPEYNTWEASYRLYQTASYWPRGTVFVNVVDPGVGTKRKSVVLQTLNDYYFVSPDNGSLTLVAEKFGIKEIREINETVNRLKNSEQSYTFHGRDVYAYTGAKLASGKISFQQVGPVLPKQVVTIKYEKARLLDSKTIIGNIPILDIQYGNVWSNIDVNLLKKLNININDKIEVTIKEKDKVKYKGIVPYVHSFGDVDDGKPLVYLNSLLQVSIALNMDSFSKKYDVYSGSDWSIQITKAK